SSRMSFSSSPRVSWVVFCRSSNARAISSARSPTETRKGCSAAFSSTSSPSVLSRLKTLTVSGWSLAAICSSVRASSLWILAGRDGQILAPPRLHQRLEPLLQDVQPLDHAADILRIEGQGVLQSLKEADEVEHEARRLAPALVVLVRPVHAGASAMPSFFLAA